MREPTNLYVLKCREFYKIGVSSRVQKRNYSIGTQIPFEIEVVANYKPTVAGLNKYDNKRAVRIIEKSIHKHFASKRVKGEWFLLNDDDLKYIPDLIKKGLISHKDHDLEIPIEVKA